LAGYGLNHDFVATHITSTRKVIFYKKPHRQEPKMLVCMYKMLTTCLIVLIFGMGDYSAKLCIYLQVHQLLSVLFLLSWSVTCVFFITCYFPQSVLLFSQQFILGTCWNTTQHHPSPPQLCSKNLFNSC